ncbi:MAG: bifunctional tRNA (5-methylaminomethyl-2-thiouridine)(34)-methyltransferase MnmD/FAD-dependent 5-carboxymethylaminomethyl-2-thiouridine(34) oxidoreductase MnmC [Piscinibacter sp.]|nr:bifunctional tRNA (5-methylaminomethyl-2-thiouridine)(34)-methyltransferase MnmD/FAD-dependent 5-carboxymethylaminomethyl-2-thiouridine(34) oxidoreductase MnmC [Piscinibacter sp.]
MKTAPVVAAALEFDAEGVPISRRYADRYHPRSGALQQAAHVFLQGNGLPARWRGRAQFAILETGFGLGNNFLATLDAWRADPKRPARLHFVSIEQHPFLRADLARAHAASPLRDLADELVRAWPPLTPDLHRLDFADGKVQLLLGFGDVATWLPALVARIDAFYLDGFAPDRNPAMWQPRVFKALARLANPGATAATWSVARSVRDGLAEAGFQVERAPGSGGKRAITLARFAPRFEPRRAPSRLATAPAPGDARHAIVVGAGLAGCAVAMALAEQGWTSTLLERLPALAAATSGNRAGVFHGIVNPQDGAHARFNRAAALHAAGAVRAAIDAHGAAGECNGVLRLEARAGVADMQASIARLGLPPEYVQALGADEASQRAGLPLAAPAWFYPGAGWIAPAAFAASLLAQAGPRATLRTDIEVASLRRAGALWQLLDAAGGVIGEAAVVVLANALDAQRLLGTPDWPLLAVRGQTSELPVATPGLVLPRLPLTGNGYVLPALPDGIALFGATSQPGDADPRLRVEDQHYNLDQLARLTGSAPHGELALAGRVGWRCVASDRLPVIGAVPDADMIAAQPTLRLDQARFVPRLPGLYVFTALASRGITWASLGARTLASFVTATPCPLDANLLDAVDAGRFAAREARRRSQSSTGPPQAN